MKLTIMIEEGEFFIRAKEVFKDICKTILNRDYFNPIVDVVEGSTWNLGVTEEQLDRLKNYSDYINNINKSKVTLYINNKKI